MLYDPAGNRYQIYNRKQADTQRSPYSTFKGQSQGTNISSTKSKEIADKLLQFVCGDMVCFRIRTLYYYRSYFVLRAVWLGISVHGSGRRGCGTEQDVLEPITVTDEKLLDKTYKKYIYGYDYIEWVRLIKYIYNRKQPTCRW